MERRKSPVPHLIVVVDVLSLRWYVASVRGLDEFDDGCLQVGVMSVGAVVLFLRPVLQQHAVRNGNTEGVQPVQSQPVHPKRVLRDFTAERRENLLTVYLSFRLSQKTPINILGLGIIYILNRKTTIN